MQHVKLLLAEDDKPLGMILKAFFDSKGFSTTICSNGEEALQALGASPFDLCITDIMMPVMDGYEVLEHLRANDATKELPVVILSALNSNDDVKRGFDLGANDFITKPIIMDKLLDSIAKQVNAIWEKKTQR